MSIRRGWLFSILALFLVAAFQVHHINSTNMREDEEIAYFSTRKDFTFAVWYQATQDVQAPAWFASFWAWKQLAGDSEFGARYYGALLSMLALALVYQIGRRWFGAPRFGLFAVLVLGVNVYYLIYSLEIRPYPMAMLMATLCMWAFGRWLRRQTWRTALLYGATAAAMLYIHYFLAFLILVQAIYFLLSRPNARLVRQAVGAAALGLVMWLPWMPVFMSQIAALNRIESALGGAREIGIRSTTEPTSWPTTNSLVQVATNGLPLVYIVCLLAGLYYGWQGRRYGLALLWALGVPAASLIANNWVAVYTQRYVAYLAVGVGIAVAFTLASLPARFRWPALILFAAVNLYAMPNQFPIRTPYRDVLKTVSKASQPGDVLLFNPAYDPKDRFVAWQVNHYLSPDLRRSITGDANTAMTTRRVWFGTTDWLNPKVQAAFKQIEKTHPLQQIAGDCNPHWCYLVQLLEGPPQTAPTVFGHQVGFWGAEIDSDHLTSVRARLWWGIDEPLSADYSIGLQLLNAQGGLIAQVDGPINVQTGAPLNTQQLEPGRIYVEAREVTVPADYPPGEYQVALVVYDWRTGERLKLPDGADHLVLKTILFGT
jgi:4-amino-4-deoxy-L-arabinose transferase-like glycosyltransferase